MNYLETGLPHTQFFPKKSNFSPPRFIPLCGLGRKYLGLEPVPKRELDIITNRLCQPKKITEPEDPSKLIREVRPITSGTGRFVGQKRMTGSQIEKMVDRLYKRQATKDFAFVDDTVEAGDIYNITDCNDSSNESDDEDDLKKNKESNTSVLRKESCASFRKDIEKPDVQIRRKSSSFFRNDTKSANANALGDKNDKPNIRRQSSVSFRRDELKLALGTGSGERNEKLDIKRLKLEIKTKGFNRETSAMPLNCRTDKYEQEWSPSMDSSKFRETHTSDIVAQRSPKVKKFESIWGKKTEVVRQPKLEEKRFTTNIDTARSSKNETTPRAAKTDAARSPDQRQSIVKFEESKPIKIVPAPCDDQLIDKVATFNTPKQRCTCTVKLS